jgi:glycosyltransferase involved in cell wall biosynthesis
MKLTIDARLVSSSGIGVYIQNIIKSPLLLNYDLELLYRAVDRDYFNTVATTVKLTEYNAGLYSINELLNTSFTTRNTDIFWSPHYNVPLFNFASRLNVVTIHDVFHLAYYHTLSTLQKVYAKVMISKAVKSKLIFTVSEFSKNEIIRHTSCNPDNIRVVHNGIDFQKFNYRFSPGVTNKVLQTYKINSPYVLFVGNVKPHKNLKTALLGFKELLCSSSGFNDYKFVIVGKREGFITGDKQLGGLLNDPFYSSRVQFTGWVKDDELPVLYQQAKTFIFPSIYEGFGFPPLEAMAAGCPVVSSDSACMPEIYQDAALYFNPLKEAEIAEALFNVLNNNGIRDTLVKKGLNQGKKYSWDSTVAKKLKYIEEFAS